MTDLCSVCGMALVRGRCVLAACASQTQTQTSSGTLQVDGPQEAFWLRSDKIESVAYSKPDGITRIRTFSGDSFELAGDHVRDIAQRLGWTPATTGGEKKV